MVRVVLVSCALAVALSGCGRSSATASPERPAYTLLQMNLCLSGLADCYRDRVDYPTALGEAVSLIRRVHPDAVTVSEGCSGDVARIARSTGYHARFSTVIYGGGPFRCVAPAGRGVFGDAVLTREAIVRSVNHAFTTQTDIERRRWLCVEARPGVEVCTAHLSTQSPEEIAGNDGQCAELATILARRPSARGVIFGGDVNRTGSCAPAGFWTRTDASAGQSPGLQQVYGSRALRRPEAAVLAFAHSDHDVLLVRARLGEIDESGGLTGMSLAVRGIFWVLAYLGVVLAPLVFALVGASQPDHTFVTNFSVALGFVGLAMMGLEFALVARFETVAAPFGEDALLQFHRQIGYVGLAFVLIHVAISAHWDQLTFHNAINAPAPVWFGMAAVLSLLALVATSTWRKRLRLSYEWWHRAHTVLAVVVVVTALIHIYFVDEYVGSLVKQVLWGLMTAAFIGLGLWVRVVKPWTMQGQPWRLERVDAERGQTTTLALTPPDGVRFRFEPGQFAWFAFGRSPFSLTKHPFSFSSSAEQAETEIAVKALGDFTSQISELEPGIPVYVDGPHGVFSIDQSEGPGFGLIAGGVGIAGPLSMLRTMADREDVRPVVLVYANRDWDGIAFRDVIDELAGRMNLTVVHVLEQPPGGWAGETGRMTTDVLSRHLPRNFRRFQFFICGPGPMMDAAERALLDLGVPGERVHTERFDMA